MASVFIVQCARLAVKVTLLYFMTFVKDHHARLTVSPVVPAIVNSMPVGVNCISEGKRASLMVANFVYSPKNENPPRGCEGTMRVSVG